MPSSETNQIIEYCKNGNTEQLIESLAHVNETQIVDDRENSLLSIALHKGHWSTFSALIENGYTHNTAKPLLISACQYKKDDPQGLELALSQNDDINIVNQNQRSALMTACLLGHIKKVEYLILNNADATIQDNTGMTALIEAVHSQNKKITEAIIATKIDVNQANKKDQTALIIAVQQKNPSEEIIKLLLDAGADPEQTDINKKSAWLIAKQKHNKISRLIEKHLNTINQIELPFFTEETHNNDPIEDPSNEAVANKHIHKDNMQEPNTGNTQTHHINHIEQNIKSTDHISDETISSPIEQEASQPITAHDEQISAVRKTDLHTFKRQTTINKQEWFHAAKIGNLGGLNRMILAGIDINCTDEKGCTALIRAAGHSKRAVVSFLLQNNADIEARSHNGSTALSSSIIGSSHRVSELLLEKNANPNGLGPGNYSYTTIAAAQWNDGMLSLLRRYGADIFICNNTQQNLLHIAALAAEDFNKINNAKATFQFLLDHGMDINSVDNKGHTALMLLCGIHRKKYHIKDREIASIVHSLLKMGAAPAMTDHSGKSAFDAASHHKLLHTKGVLMNALSWND